MVARQEALAQSLSVRPEEFDVRWARRAPEEPGIRRFTHQQLICEIQILSLENQYAE